MDALSTVHGFVASVLSVQRVLHWDIEQLAAVLCIAFRLKYDKVCECMEFDGRRVEKF